MKTYSHLQSALWNAIEAEVQLTEMLAQLNELHRKLPDEFHSQLVDILDKFHTAQSQVQATKHHLIICLRADK